MLTATDREVVMVGSTVVFPNKRAVRDLIREQCGDKLNWDGQPLFPHLLDVAKWARGFHENYLIATASWVSPSHKVMLDSMVCAGLLCRSIESQGFDFEQLVRLVNLDTAVIVSQASCDMRLPFVQRNTEFMSRISTARREAQVLKLAQIFVGLHNLIAISQAPLSDEAEAYVEDWLPYADTALHSMPALRKSPFLRDIWNETVEDLDELGKALSRTTLKTKMINELTARIAAKKIRKAVPRSALHATEAEESSDGDT